MADLDKTRSDAEGQLFDEIGRLHAGMLGIEGSGQHSQPMTPYFDRSTEELWFITSRQTDLVRAIGQGAQGSFTFVGKDNDYYASLRGAIVQSEDEQKLDDIWNAVAAAWFDDGRRDPDVILLRMTLRDAAIWASGGSSVNFGLEIARAHMDREAKPDLGEHKIINFDHAA